MSANAVARREDRGQVVAAGDMAEQQKTAQQGHPPGAGDGERHARAVARIAALLPVTDEQEGGQAGQLPEDQQQEDVLRQHHAQHGSHEQQQAGIEAPHAVPRGQVIAGIENDQQADAQNHQGEQQPQAVQAKGQIQSHRRHPGETLDHGMAGEGRARQRQQTGQGEQGHGSRHPGGVQPAPTGNPGGQNGAEERREDDQRQTHGISEICVSATLKIGRAQSSAG